MRCFFLSSYVVGVLGFIVYFGAYHKFFESEFSLNFSRLSANGIVDES
jgi:hypothetical protein